MKKDKIRMINIIKHKDMLKPNAIAEPENKTATVPNIEENDEDIFFKSKVGSFWSLVWRRFRSNKLAVVGSISILIILLAAVFAPLICPYSPIELHLDIVVNGKPNPPSKEFIFGTDGLGRDYFTRCIYGGRVSLLVGFSATLLSALIGVPLGCLAGYYGGIVDMVIMRAIDILGCIPNFFLLLIVSAMLKPSQINVILVLGLFGWMGMARQIRAQFLSLRSQEFVQAAVALGLKDRAIVFRHIMPNAIMPVVVSATMQVAGNIMAESGLSYLGLGVQEPMSSWGTMLQISKSYITSAPWMMIFPGLFICAITLAINFIGDGLRDALDPRTIK